MIPSLTKFISAISRIGIRFRNSISIFTLLLLSFLCFSSPMYQNMMVFSRSAIIQISHTFNYGFRPPVFPPCVPLFSYLSVRLSGFSRVSGVAASLLLIFDTSLATEGRFILSDGILHFFFCSLHIFVLCYTFSQPRRRHFWLCHI